ncbi:MAG TPA: M28 family metallopeptidase [Thermoanaerobaculia bacterium]|nr:M28 family metallopeptidase [Thermoanaerobaculia bacterium]
MRLSLLAISLHLVAATLAAQIPDEARSASRAIQTSAIEAHMRFLADDLLEGRETGTRGYDVAARYVAAQLQAVGVAPAGDKGTWYQAVPLRKAEIVKKESSLSLKKAGEAAVTLAEDDFSLTPDYLQTSTKISASVVFVGFGIAASELGYDDYAGVDVRGKIVAILSGAPSTFLATTRAHYSSSFVKAETAAAHGARGIITLRPPAAEKRYPWERFVKQARPGMRWLGTDKVPGRTVPQIQATVTLGRRAAEALFAGAPRSLDDVFKMEEGPVRPSSFPLAVEASIRITTRHSEVESMNVVGLLKGRDSALAAETIIYTAHLDHVGLATTPVGADSINNGAMDNASGIAALLEVARAFSALPKATRRSIMFLAVTGEEKGLLGSDYFATFPTIARERMVGNINMDMFLMLFPMRDVVVYGYDHSSMARQVDHAVRELGIKRIADPAPEETIFVRSDQYSFVRAGIPALAIGEGVDAGASKVKGADLVRAWRRDRYHQVSDDLNQPIDFGAGTSFAKLNFLIGYLAASQDKRPTWNEGDFFGTRFSK